MSCTHITIPSSSDEEDQSMVDISATPPKPKKKKYKIEVVVETDNRGTKKRKKRSSLNAFEPVENAQVNNEISILDSTYSLAQIHNISPSSKSSTLRKEVPTVSDVWSCEFHPVMDDVFAVCCANTVCIINVRQEQIVQKYTHLETEEEFYALGWTKLENKDLRDGNTDHANESCILAAAGKLGSIKLLDPLQNECYRYLHGHTRAVTALRFSSANPRHLFSASKDQTIRLWDIGIDPSQSSCLNKLQTIPHHPTTLALSQRHILVGCYDGTMLRYPLSPPKAQPDRIYLSSVEWHESSVIGVHVCQDGWVISAAGDGEVLVWDGKESTPEEAVVKCVMDWGFDVGAIKVIERARGGAVVVGGDEEGRIRIASVREEKRGRTLDDWRKNKLEPDLVLEHPQSKKGMQDVGVSRDGKVIVGVNTEGWVLIWRALLRCTGESRGWEWA